MKLSLKHFSLASYLRHLRRQNKHMQRVHAVAFAAIVTGLIATFVLYTDYGFWHEKYSRTQEDNATSTPMVVESPSEAFSHFFSEARTRFSNVGASVSSSSKGLLEGKETYTK